MALAGANPASGAGTIKFNDPIAVEIVKNALISVADEMSSTVIRGGYSTFIKEGADASSAILSHNGELVAQAIGTNLLHSASLREAVKAVLQDYPPETMCEGDVYLMNDPSRGGVHSNDIEVFRPVFSEGKLVFITGTLIHVADLGGVSGGGLPAQATEIFHEGLLLPPVPLYQAGAENKVVAKIIALNSRTPEKVIGDIRALVAGCNVGAERLGALIERYGSATLQAIAVQLLDYSEALMRREIERLPEGPLKGEFSIDDDGIDRSRHYRVQVTVTRKGSEITVDCTGTDQQARGAINASYSQALTGVIYGVRCFVDPTIPMNEGVFRVIHAVLPPGTLVRPGPHAAVNARIITVMGIVEAIRDAWSTKLPQSTGASGINNMQMVSGRYADSGRAWVMMDADMGGLGAVTGKDGEDCTYINGRSAVSQVEALEAEFPLRYERHALIPDSGGPGQWRGGLGVERVFRLTAEAEISVRGDRFTLPPIGRLGGLPGRGGSWTINRGRPDERALASKQMGIRMMPGDTLTLFTSGGGGLGPPEKRDPEAVRKDVTTRRVSAAQAHEVYRVVVDPVTFKLDERATEALRRQAPESKGTPEGKKA